MEGGRRLPQLLPGLCRPAGGAEACGGRGAPRSAPLGGRGAGGAGLRAVSPAGMRHGWGLREDAAASAV